jgi:tetratricopeptide (TPR) repeat protein
MGRVLAILSALLLLHGAAARAQTAAPAGQVPLAKALEGLAPGPRIAYLEYLIKQGSVDPEVYFQLGVAFYDGEKPDSALAAYERAVELDPGLSKAYVNMGVILDGQHRTQDALSMFERAVAANPRDVLAQAHAAYVLFEDRRYEDAWRHLARALAIDSLAPQPHYDLAIFFWESGMFRESLVEWEKVVSLAPASPLAKTAEENITVLQEALTGPQGGELPERRP